MNFIDFAKTIGKLKKIKRTGWIKFGKVDEPESVAEHVMRLTVLALVAAEELGVNSKKFVEMAIVHDLAESLVGDIIAEHGNKVMKHKKSEKYRLERKAMEELFEGLTNADIFLNLWQEFEDQETKEAKVLRQLDKFEMVLQALEYEDSTNPKNLDIFWAKAKKSIKHPYIKKWLRQIQLERKNG